MYVDAWRKSCAGEILSALESQIAEVIRDHPEYQPSMSTESLEASYSPEGGQTNPFLHMGLHLAVREQVQTNRPPGIAEVFAQLLAKSTDRHAAEHQALDCLAEALWTAQSNNTAPDEQAYLECLRRLCS
jgi:hypothetical protein